MIFEIDNIELGYGKDLVLSGVYIKAETGKTTGILGANGTGKSSLLNVIFGSISSNNRLVRIDSKAYLKPLFTSGLVKFLPQHPFIPKHLLLEGAFKLYQVNLKEFFVEFPEFKAFRKVKISILSGGERRIIEIYLSLKSPSELVLLDEPFTHLSPLVIERFRRLIQIEKQKKAVIISDHMYHHVIEVADSLYLLKNSCSQLVKDPKELVEYHYLQPNSL